MHGATAAGQLCAGGVRGVRGVRGMGVGYGRGRGSVPVVILYGLAFAGFGKPGAALAGAAFVAGFRVSSALLPALPTAAAVVVAAAAEDPPVAALVASIPAHTAV